MLKKLVTKFKELIHKLFSLKDTPHAIAGGVAIGMFLGFSPLFGIKTLLALGLAYLLRCNAVAAVIAVSLHDVVTPIWPVLFRIQYDIGFWVMSNPHVLPPKLEHHHIPHVSEFFKFAFYQQFDWSTFVKIGLPMSIGSLFFSIPASIISYFAMLALVKRSRLGKEKA